MTTAVIVGGAGVLVAFVEGVVLMFKRKVTACENGHLFKEGTKDFTCYAHPHAAEGLALVALSLSIGALLLISVLVAASVLKLRDS